MYNNPYSFAPNPYSPSYQTYTPQNANILPPQQILTAKGKTSVEAIKMSPNSSVLIADETAPIVWRCTSDSLGNVSAEAFDITPHKDETIVQQETLQATVLNIEERLKRLEAEYNDSRQSLVDRSGKQQYNAESRSSQASTYNSQKHAKSTSSSQSNDSEQP